MAVYRPSYRDPKTNEKRQQLVWWYNFTFAGRRIQESSKSTRKTVAVEAEKNRRRELERGFNQIEDNRRERIRSVAELADEFFEAYKVRNPTSATFADYAIDHVKKILGKNLSVDVNDAAVKTYQTTRLKEKASPKSINEEIGFLLRILGEQGDYLRAKLRRARLLKLSTTRQNSRAYGLNEKAALLKEARRAGQNRYTQRSCSPSTQGCATQRFGGCSGAEST